MKDQQILERIHWLGHDTFFIDGSKKILFDPYQIAKPLQADIICLTHEHFDHCSPEDIAKVTHKNTVIIGPADALAKLKGNLHPIKSGQSYKLEGVEIDAVSAYNLNKKFHPRENGWLGYVLRLDGFSLYHAGDTDFIPEMKNIHVDVALLPVSGTYVMTPEEAAQAALTIKPRIAAIPMHYGTVVGSRPDADLFQKLLHGKIPVVIKEQG